MTPSLEDLEFDQQMIDQVIALLGGRDISRELAAEQIGRFVQVFGARHARYSRWRRKRRRRALRHFQRKHARARLNIHIHAGFIRLGVSGFGNAMFGSMAGA